MATFKIHPAIGIARVGNHPTDFYLAPEKARDLPYECDEWGNPSMDGDTPQPIDNFKVDHMVRRQAARFRVLVYDADNPGGRPIQIGDQIEGIGSSGPLIDIVWTCYLANKKSVWYQFNQLEGEHGYPDGSALRNADVTESHKRQKLITDPGWISVNGVHACAEFAEGKNHNTAQNFPPDLFPNSVKSLGGLKTNDNNELIVLGGFGNSGSCKTGCEEPVVETYANNDGWFDDTSDGPVTAFLAYYDESLEQVRYLQIEDPAWVIVGYPAYAPQIPDIVNTDDIVYDLSVRNFGYEPSLFGTAPYDQKPPSTPEELASWRLKNNSYNPDYWPYFWRDVWPILDRAFYQRYVTTLLSQSLDPHETGQSFGKHANFNPDFLSMPPQCPCSEEEGCNGGDQLSSTCQDPGCVQLFKDDPYWSMRVKIWMSLRQPGQENVFSPKTDAQEFQYLKPLMPLLCGDNPISNDLPSKFLRLTDTQLFIIRQWTLGKFINEKKDGLDLASLEPDLGTQIDRGVLSHGLGGAFCPGAETAWIIRNPAIYASPYRINANLNFMPNMQTSSVANTPGQNIYQRPQLSQEASYDEGVEPGDITKYSALPWQTDFNECTYQPIDVTYELWNVTNPGNAYEKSVQQNNLTIWWPAHRPLQVQNEAGTYVDWSAGIPGDKMGDYKMTTAWKDLGFIKYTTPTNQPASYYQVERNDAALGPQLYPQIPAPSADGPGNTPGNSTGVPCPELKPNSADSSDDGTDPTA